MVLSLCHMWELDMEFCICLWAPFLLAGKLKAVFPLSQLETLPPRHSSFLSGERNERKHRFSCRHMGHFTCQKIKQVQTKLIRNDGLECIIWMPLCINVGDARKILQDKLQLISDGSISDTFNKLIMNYHTDLIAAV